MQTRRESVQPTARPRSVRGRGHRGQSPQLHVPVLGRVLGRRVRDEAARQLCRQLPGEMFSNKR